MTLSEAISKGIAPVTFLVTKRKKYILYVLLSAIFFYLVFFPYEDLSDSMTGKIAKLTGNQVFIQSESLSLGFFPSLSLVMKDVAVDTPDFPTLKAGYLKLAPSLLKLITGKVGFSASAQDFLDGDIDVSFSQGKKLEGEDNFENSVSIDAEDINIKKIETLFTLPLRLQGKMALDADATFDTLLANAPNAEFTFTAKDFVIPAQTIPTEQMGPLPIPQLQFSKIQLNGRWAGSELIIKDAELGDPKDPIYLKLHFQERIELRRYGGSGVQPNFGPYTVKINLNTRENAPKEFTALLFAYDKYKQKTNTGLRYLFQLSGSPGRPPNDSSIQNF